MLRIPTGISLRFLQRSSRPTSKKFINQHIKLTHTNSILITPPSRNASGSTGLLSKDVREVQIPVPWGHISGKWWGSTDHQPVLGLHGWQDNAGTFDRLAPMLPSDVSLLAVDFPGHGLSSHYHPGRNYHFLEYVLFVRRIMNYYKWDNVSLLGHSLGGILSFVFSCVYPELVHNYICIDAMKPYSYKPLTSIRKGGKLIDSHLKVQGFDHGKTPSYSYEDAGARLTKGTHESITKETVDYLLKRGLVETSEGKFQYRRDSRLKVEQMMSWTHEMILELASNIRCNVCVIDGNPGLVYDKPEKHQAAYDVVKKSAKKYEYHLVDGTHHLHLTTPERVAPIIINFLNSNKI